MGNEHGKESRDITPYVPNEWDRARLAKEIRDELQKTLGGRDTVTRYLDNGERAKIPLPRGEELLGNTRLEYVRKFRGLTHLRAWVTMRCTPPPGRRFVWNDDYREVVEVQFDDRILMANLAEPPVGHHRYADMDDETPARPAKRETTPPASEQGRAIRAITAALLLGVAAVIGEQHFGVLSSARKTIESTVRQLHGKYDEWRGGQWAQPPPRYDGPGPRMIRYDDPPERGPDRSRPVGGGDDAGEELVPQRFVPERFEQLSQETFDQ